MNRPALQKMRRLARAERFTHVVAYNLRTLTTTARDFIEIHSVLKEHQTNLVLQEDNVG